MSKYTFSTSVGRFRIVGFAEALSFILLLGVAMPLKYAAGIPEAVKYTGWAHGLLFVAYIFVTIETAISLRWSFKNTVLALLASLFPFGPFIFDKYILKDAA